MLRSRMPKRRSMSGSVSQLHVRLPGRLSRWSLPSPHCSVSTICASMANVWPVWSITLANVKPDGQDGSKFPLLIKCSKIKFFNFWLVNSDVMKISTNANRILIRTTRRAIIWSAVTFAIVQKISSASIARSARRHLRQRALPQRERVWFGLVKTR